MREYRQRHSRDDVAQRHHLPFVGPKLPTERSIEALKARFRHGSVKEAAASMGISRNTYRGHMTTVCERTGTANAYEAAYVLWLRHEWGEG